jgi:hypothetical protein
MASRGDAARALPVQAASPVRNASKAVWLLSLRASNAGNEMKEVTGKANQSNRRRSDGFVL